MEKEFQYYAFISYKREDEKWAKWLQSKLENYKLPAVIANGKQELPKRLNPVFRDTTDIKPGVLADVLSQNLNSSKYLIVVCSPMAAKSAWVGKEISDFIALGKQNNIILFIVEGKPYSNEPRTECYHHVIKEKLPEMLGININEEGKDWKYIKKQKAFIRAVSSLLNVSFDSLWQRQKRRIIRNWVLRTVGILFFVLSLVGISVYQNKINQPFDVQISLKETTFQNPNLPFENGIVKLMYNKDTLTSKPINSHSKEISFNNIPGKFKTKIANLKFEMFGYEPIDTIVQLNAHILIPVHRDGAYSKVQGYVRNYITDKFETGITVEIEKQQTHTNNDGFFQISIPLELQKTSYQVTLQKNNHVVKGQTVYPTKNEKSIINTLYFK